MAGGKPASVDSYPDFRVHADRVEKAITPKTKLLVLNSPSNPTGIVMSEQEVRAAVEIAKKHDLLILSDEIYERFQYEGVQGSGSRVPGQSSLPSAAKLYDKTIVLRGFSK